MTKEEFKIIKEFKKKYPEVFRRVNLDKYDYTSSINTDAFVIGFILGWNNRDRI